MIPYWLTHCRALIAATGEPPAFGRPPGSTERLDGVARGATAEPEALLAQLEREVRAAAGAIRALTAAERARRGVYPGRGEMTVAQVVDSIIVSHAEEHLAQVRAALAR
jgi:hypothetical protein